MQDNTTQHIHFNRDEINRHFLSLHFITFNEMLSSPFVYEFGRPGNETFTKN